MQIICDIVTQVVMGSLVCQVATRRSYLGSDMQCAKVCGLLTWPLALCVQDLQGREMWRKMQQCLHRSCFLLAPRFASGTIMYNEHGCHVRSWAGVIDVRTCISWLQG